MNWTQRLRLAWYVLRWAVSLGASKVELSDRDLVDLVKNDPRVDYAHLTLSEGGTVEKRDHGDMVYHASRYGEPFGIPHDPDGRL